MNKIFFVIGASGAGKTTAIKSIQSVDEKNFHFCYFDSVGVPTPEEMVRGYGSGEDWQRITTEKWVEKISTDFITSKPTILDGQIKPSFIDGACKLHNIINYDVILFDCSDDERKQRLVDRGQPELANEDMMNWSKYLREESEKRGYVILDNTDMSKEETAEQLMEILNRLA